eukprot:6062646-Lingulodinium_polyedra.AAC.1
MSFRPSMVASQKGCASDSGSLALWHLDGDLAPPARIGLHWDWIGRHRWHGHAYCMLIALSHPGCLLALLQIGAS